ncbi:hypothetical protein B0H13DRAFT_1903513 [Mycena leptocephala]|nr:hypothetical protein B0H13DRAFT_1903513 [Mycena leptocephala]
MMVPLLYLSLVFFPVLVLATGKCSPLELSNLGHDSGVSLSPKPQIHFRLVEFPVYQELFLWNNDYNTTLSPLNGTCHSQCEIVHQTFKYCTSSPEISQCLCTDNIGGELGSCVSCIVAVTDSKLLNATVKHGLLHWALDCKIDDHNVSQPQVNTTSGLALVANAECRNISPRVVIMGILVIMLGIVTVLLP